MHVLITEDDNKIANFLRREFIKESFAVDLAKDGEEALYKVDINVYDIIILDIKIPKVNGIDVCIGMRERNIATPILILTAASDTASRIKGLDAGADDYLTKPFSFEELMARIRALLRRGTEVKPTVLKIDNLILDPATRKVTRNSKQINLTSKEYAILYYFMNNLNVLITKSEILEHVWDYNYEGMSNIVEVYIKNLRKKLKVSTKNKDLIRTLRGSGYIMHL